MLLASIGLFLSAHAATANDLTFRCPDGFYYWNKNNVPESKWYFENDWDEWLQNSTDPLTGEAWPGVDGNGDEIVIEYNQGDSPVYPAGFQPFILARYSEPPICIMAQGSRNKKVEILMESPMDNVNLCITDASYSGTGTNDVGSVQNCGTGKIYACFTGATADSSENFGFYVDCQEGCEDMDIEVWIRIRVSDRSWDEGKEQTSDTDLEHWCEQERGTTVDDEGNNLYYTYPSDLLPDEPSEYPFHIRQIFGFNSGSQTKPRVWLVSLVAMVGLACLFA